MKLVMIYIYMQYWWHTPHIQCFETVLFTLPLLSILLLFLSCQNVPHHLEQCASWFRIFSYCTELFSPPLTILIHALYIYECPYFFAFFQGMGKKKLIALPPPFLAGGRKVNTRSIFFYAPGHICRAGCERGGIKERTEWQNALISRISYYFWRSGLFGWHVLRQGMSGEEVKWRGGEGERGVRGGGGTS